MKLSSIEISPGNDNEEIKFITHYGVWWKIYIDSEYIEDFPYCPCCEPKQKLIQTAWSPDEKYKCPKTGTEVMLYDSIPWTKEKVLSDLYRAYFSGQHFEEEFLREYHRIKLLSPNAKEEELLRDIFKIEPFNGIPKNEIERIVQRFKTSIEVMHFIKSHYKSYRNYFKIKVDN